MTRVLGTGFEPFGAETVNPSWRAVSTLAEEPPPGLEVTAVRLSGAFGTAVGDLREAVGRVRPGLVLRTGQAGGRADITVERLAANVNDARIPDNSGRQPVDEPVVDGGPAAYFSGLPASVSQTAGVFVCNKDITTVGGAIR